eukprot:1129-Chlamydomonas_euryale.AAC.1
MIFAAAGRIDAANGADATRACRRIAGGVAFDGTSAGRACNWITANVAANCADAVRQRRAVHKRTAWSMLR